MVTYLTEFLQEKRERAALVSAREMVGSQEALLVPKNWRQVSGAQDSFETECRTISDLLYVPQGSDHLWSDPPGRW